MENNKSNNSNKYNAMKYTNNHDDKQVQEIHRELSKILKDIEKVFNSSKKLKF